MAHNERTSRRMATLGSRAMRDPHSITIEEIKSMGAGLITQAPDRHPEDELAYACSILERYDALPVSKAYVDSVLAKYAPPGAHAVYNAMAPEPSLAAYLRTRPADETIAGGWSSDNAMAKPTRR